MLTQGPGILTKLASHAHVLKLVRLLHKLLSRGKMWKIRIFSVECCLLAFNIVAQGPIISLKLFVSRAYVASYHAYHIYPRPVFSSEKP